MHRLLLSCAVAIGATATPLNPSPPNGVSTTVSVSVDPSFLPAAGVWDHITSSLAENGQARYGFPTGVTVEREGAASHRRAQARPGASGPVLAFEYQIQCGDNCASVQDTLTAFGQEHAQAIIDAINADGAAGGWGSTVVTSNVVDVVSSISAPTAISIVVNAPAMVWAAGCVDLAAAAVAEDSCKDANGCSACVEEEFGDDCASNSREHCDEIVCCAACEVEIRAMFSCEHGSTCGMSLSCPAVAPAPAPAPPAPAASVAVDWVIPSGDSLPAVSIAVGDR